MDKRLFDKTLQDLTVKDGIKLYLLASLGMALYSALKNGQGTIKYVPNPTKAE